MVLTFTSQEKMRGKITTNSKVKYRLEYPGLSIGITDGEKEIGGCEFTFLENCGGLNFNQCSTAEDRQDAPEQVKTYEIDIGYAESIATPHSIHSHRTDRRTNFHRKMPFVSIKLNF